jgi:hypothetical protein
MELERDELQKAILELYTREHSALGEKGTQEHLERGLKLKEKFNLTKTLNDGGVLVFPHAGVADCGYQIAACVQAALDTGKKVLVISVLHAFTQAMEDARRSVAAGVGPSKFEFWGIQGTGLSERREWESDHALMSWRQSSAVD